MFASFFIILHDFFTIDTRIVFDHRIFMIMVAKMAPKSIPRITKNRYFSRLCRDLHFHIYFITIQTHFGFLLSCFLMPFGSLLVPTGSLLVPLAFDFWVHRDVLTTHTNNPNTLASTPHKLTTSSIPSRFISM